MPRPLLEVADIFRRHGPEYRAFSGAGMLPQQQRAMRAIESCRTAALGGHARRCDQCGHQDIAYNSCRNRHCPKCQSLAKADWLQARREELLPAEYFHLVFTLPNELAPLALHNKRLIYTMLFQAASRALLRIAADPQHLGAKIGFIAVLHTWGQNLMHHPHLHCVVPGGGLSLDERQWVSCRKGFLLPVRVLSRLFRRLFLDALQQAFRKGGLQLQAHAEAAQPNDPKAFSRLLQSCRRKEWVVYCKPPFGGAEKVLGYLGRYTHRIALSNNRLTGLANGQVSFHWRNYRKGGRQRTMTLAAQEFIRRFLLHVLPHGFMRIRSYGLFANCHRTEKLRRCRSLLGAPNTPAQDPKTGKPPWNVRIQALTGRDPLLCPVCRQGRLVEIQDLQPVPRLGQWLAPVTRAPPQRSAS